MSLDPQVRAVLDQMAAMGMPAFNTLTPEQARAQMEMTRAAAPPGDPVHQVEDRAIPGQGGEIPIRIYRPAGDGPLPALVFFHGGGWVIGSLDTHDGVCRALCVRTPCLVVSVEYRLAPEHRFPAAVEDAWAATAWVAEHAGSIGGAASRIAVGGDSSGGTLAAVVALRAYADRLEDAAVERALRDGWSWSEIAEALGVTRQAVHKKHIRRLEDAGIDLRRRRG